VGLETQRQLRVDPRRHDHPARELLLGRAQIDPRERVGDLALFGGAPARARDLREPRLTAPPCVVVEHPQLGIEQHVVGLGHALEDLVHRRLQRLAPSVHELIGMEPLRASVEAVAHGDVVAARLEPEIVVVRQLVEALVEPHDLGHEVVLGRHRR
jgi:hypothetical protein